MKGFRWFVLATVAVLATACEQPTVDPDQAVRDLIAGPHWVSDDAYRGVDAADFQVIFRVNGTALLHAGQLGTWTYKKKVFTLTYPENGQVGGTEVVETTTVPEFAVSRSAIQFRYLGGLNHLKILGQ